VLTRTEHGSAGRGAKAIPVIETLRQFAMEMIGGGIKGEHYFGKKNMGKDVSGTETSVS
jgi:hypothetical protein